MMAQQRRNPADLVLIEQWARRNLEIRETGSRAREILDLIQEVRDAMDKEDEKRAMNATRRLALEALEIAESQDLSPWDLFANKMN